MVEIDKIVSVGRTVIEEEAQSLLHLAQSLGPEFQKAVELIVKNKGRLILVGMGKAGHIARKLAATFASTGTPAFFVHPAEAAHGDLGMITRTDLVIILSHSGSSEEVINILPVIHEIGAKVIAITGKPDSPLAKNAKLTLITGVTREADPRGQAPTSSAVAMLALGDALAIAVSEIRGFTREDFKRFHPGGALGRQN
ncbi:MAG: SIS domain-containing protein [Veillonellaceae bacterium]|nr:SIS domain-containing protein [Veillonellaceae bacterium]